MNKRELKFRAWNKYTNKMNNRVAVNGKNVISIWTDMYGQICTRIIDDQNDARYDYIPMQYINLKDKNRVEIYEGDILKFENKDDNTLDFDLYYEVVWDGQKFYLKTVDNLCDKGRLNALKEKRISAIGSAIYPYFPLNEHMCKKYEVIGNIYENPELLEDNNS